MTLLPQPAGYATASKVKPAVISAPALPRPPGHVR